MLSERIKQSVFCVIVLVSSIFAYPQNVEGQVQSPDHNHASLVNTPVQKKTLVRDEYPYGGTIVWGARQRPSIINPILTTQTVSADLLGIIMNSLIKVNARGEIEPGLAESWEISEDGLVYTFHVRRGVRFHDGVECNAEDVRFTYEQIMDPVNQSPYRSHFTLIKQIEAPDPYTLRIILSESFTPLLFELADREIVPQHLLEGEDLQNTPFNEHPVGTGPFRLERWDKETGQIELSANPDYFEGRPYLDAVIVKVYPDSARLWAGMMRQEIDLILDVSKEDYQVLREDPAFRTYAVSWDKYCAIAYDLNDPILKDRETRKAVALGIDRKKILEDIGRGGIISTGPFHPDSPGFNPEVKAFEYDPVRAKRVLSLRGWYDTDDNGVLERGGRELEIRMLVDDRSDIYRKIAMMIRQQLSEIGIRVRVILYSDEDALTEAFLKESRPQAWLRFYKGLGLDPQEAVGSWYSLSSEAGKIWDYRNKAVDTLLRSGCTAKDLDERLGIYQKVHEMIYEDQPVCFLFFPVIYYAVSEGIQDTDEFFNTYMPVYTMKNWYIMED